MEIMTLDMIRKRNAEFKKKEEEKKPVEEAKPEPKAKKPSKRKYLVVDEELGDEPKAEPAEGEEAKGE